MKIFIFFAAFWLQQYAFSTDVLPQKISREDGSEIWYYHNDVPDNNETLFVIVQGGSCISVPHQQNRMALFKDLKFKADTLWVEKYGLTNEDRGDQCPSEFIENNSPLQRVDDYLAVFDLLKDQYQRIIVLGAREGAAIMSLLLADESVPISAAIAINTGGGSYANDMVWQIEKVRPMDDLEIDHPVISKFLEQGKSGKIADDVGLLDHNYRWWYEMLNTNMYKTLKNSHKPLLIIQGLADRQLSTDNLNTPYYCLINKENVTVYYYEDLNHELADSFEQPDIPCVVKDVQYWLEHLG